jgi:isoleucyl-tRNA synthetase
VPIPVFTCGKCGEVVATEATFDAVIDLFYREGADSWFTKAPAEYLPADTCCAHCGAGVEELQPEKDILDVWWESGVSHQSVLRHRADEGLTWPADMYLEGSDQHRGWFQSSLLTSVGAYGQPPYKSVMHCGFTVDENGEKMSKSKGNGIDPAEVMDKFGADVLRLWVSSVDYAHDVSISDNILKQVSDAYRKFRNSLRFVLGNLDDFDNSMCVASWDDLEPIDKYMMAKTYALLRAAEESYDTYRFNAVYRDCYDFVNELSSVYLDVTKDRLYSEAPDSPRRRAVQTVLMNILEVLVRVLAPILSFTCDEVWEHFPPALRGGQDRPASVQLAGWPARSDFAPALPAADATAETIRVALRGAPTDPRLWKALAARYKVDGNPALSLACLLEALSLTPSDTDIVAEIALRYDELGCPGLAQGAALFAFGTAKDEATREKVKPLLVR